MELNNNSPIFVVGMPRSGTTLMTAMLSAHPNIAIPAETHFLRYWYQKYSDLDLTNQANFQQFWQDFTQNERFYHLGIDTQLTFHRILNQKKIDWKTIFTSILQQYAISINKVRWGEKTPDHYQYVELLLNWYPQARIIWMIRDPRAVTASLLTMPWANNYADQHAKTWQKNIQLLQKWEKTERIISIYYEDLITKTELTLKKICHFIAEEYTPQMIEGRSQKSSPLINRQGQALINKSKALKPIDLKAINKWQQQLLASEIEIIEHITKAEMRQHNYQTLTNKLSLLTKLIWIQLIIKKQKVFINSLIHQRLKKIKNWQITTYLLNIIEPLMSLKAKTISCLFDKRIGQSFNHWQDYLKKQNIVGYVGFVGYQNLGDEALYLGIKQLFPKLNILIYYSPTEPDYRLKYKSPPLEMLLYRTLIKRENFYNCVFLGGGTLIHWQSYLDWFKTAIKEGKPAIVFGTGVGNPRFWQQQRPDINYDQLMKEWVAVIKDANYVSVRGFQSARILEEYGLAKPEVIGDPALSLCHPRSPNFSRQKIIGVNLGSHGFVRGKQSYINDVIACFIHHLLLEDWQIEFLPFHSYDLQLVEILINDYHLQKISIWREYQNIAKTLERIKTYDLVIGQRLHSAVLSCGCSVPSILLNYQPKCFDFMESINQEQFCLNTDSFNLENLLYLFSQIQENYEQYCNQITLNCNKYRTLQKESSQNIINCLANIAILSAEGGGLSLKEETQRRFLMTDS
ncbi:sulfotransferase [Geminocystis sp. GBBB08]|uniref:sulfotransferase n=1 Tax=Geminocystis sp. GBBB08 TaxID=2604140 RepID=UPI0027E33D59|nr:sulfotransferase [Geminocystis sp. GBBB08]MBL1209296.1 hypothetical protein [Geminocystis sp. GBBB08]